MFIIIFTGFDTEAERGLQRQDRVQVQDTVLCAPQSYRLREVQEGRAVSVQEQCLRVSCGLMTWKTFDRLNTRWSIY